MSNVTTTEALIAQEQTILVHFEPLFSLIIIFTFSLNLYILVIIIANKKLHVPVNMFIASICVVGIVIACIDMPFQLLYMDANYTWAYGLETCIMWYIFDLSLCSISLLNFAFITFIRYMAIIKPQGDWAPKKIQILVLCLIWMVPFFAWAISLNILMRQKMPDDNDCYLSIDFNYSLAADSFAFLIPLIALVVLNMKLIWELKKRSKKVIGNKKDNKKVASPQSILVQPIAQDVSMIENNSASTTININTIQSVVKVEKKIVNPSLKKEKKAILVLIILQVGFIVCWLPFIIVFPMDSLSISLNSDFNNLVYWIAYFNSLINAIVLISTSDNYQVLCKKSTYEMMKKKLENLKHR